MTNKEFICEWCAELFESEWTDADAIKEYERNFPTEMKAHPVHTGDVSSVSVVCDDCYNNIMGSIDADPQTTN